MRKLPIFLGFALLFVFTPAARAAIIGTVPSVQVEDAMAGKGNSYDLFSLNGTAFTDLKTNIGQTNGSGVWKINSTVYYNSTDGLYSQTIGQNTAKIIKTQKSLEGELFLGKNWLVSNKGKAESGQSFFFNVQTKKVTKFTPAVKTIAMADATADKLTVAMIAKNGQGKQKLFVSTTSINKVREYPLPTHAKSCDGLAIAPKGKTVIVGCTYTVSGKSQDGFAIYTRNGNDLKLVTNSYKNNSIIGLAWLDDQKVIALIDMSSGAIEVHAWTVAKGKITKDDKLFSNGTSEASGQTFNYSPFQLLRWTSTKFYYNMLYVFTADTSTYYTFIGSYDLSTGESNVVVNNANFQVIL
jgi:hypothetical protein